MTASAFSRRVRPMASIADGVAAPVIRPRISRDSWIMFAYLVMVGLYLMAALALPLYTMIAKSFEDYGYNLYAFEFQVDKGDGWSEPKTAAQLNAETGAIDAGELSTT